MNNSEILKILDYDSDYDNGFVALEDGKENRDENRLSTLQSRFIDEAGDFNIDGIYFSGEYPIIYFKCVNSFDKSELNDIISIHKKTWNQYRVPFLFVNSPLELRIYNCFKKPVHDRADIRDIAALESFRFHLNDDRQRLSELQNIFGRASLESGWFWTKEEYAASMDSRQRVDRTLIKSLKETRTELLKNKLPLKIVHNLLIRSLFILYLEDRKATTPPFYKKFLSHAKSYFDILEDKNATYQLFKALDESFNGNLFPVSPAEKELVTDSHLLFIKNCFWDGHQNNNRLFQWRIFDFSIIPIELISEIYEEFLKTESGEEKMSRDGSYYTPLSLVEFILNIKLPWGDENHTDYKLKIIDPACGSGIFLVEAYRRLVDRWKYRHKNKKITSADLKNILLHSIYGVEINREAIKVTAFSLYLAMLDHLEPKHIWNFVRFPILMHNPGEHDSEKQGFNLFPASSLQDGIFSNHEYDLVVGNPPFKRGGLENEAKDYLKRLDFAQEYVLAFLHRAVQLSPNGQIAMVAASKILFNNSGTYENFRKFLFNDTHVEAVYNFSILRKAKAQHGGQLIPSAVGPVCVLFYSAKKPDAPDEKILFCAPKSPIKRNMVEGIVIDSSDVKYLPRATCALGGTTIWKVGMWGTERDYNLIEKLKHSSLLGDFLSKKQKSGWSYGVGFQVHSPANKTAPGISNLPFLDARRIERYTTLIERTQRINRTKFRRLGNQTTYFAPHLVLKKGQTNKRFCASYLDYNCSFRDGVYGISANNEEKNLLKALTAYINSAFCSYFLMLTISSFGIEREQIMLEEYLMLPALPLILKESDISRFAGKVDKIISLKKHNPVLKVDTSAIEEEIDEMIYEAFGLSHREKHLIEDTIKFSLDLFQEGEKSEALHRPTMNELENYAGILCEDINDLLRHSETTVSTTIYQVSHFSPLNMIAIRFSNRGEPGGIVKNSSQTEISNLLKQIDRYTYEQFSQSVYYRKVVKYYDNDTIYLIKPNEKRSWSRSQAMNDADDILVEISSH